VHRAAALKNALHYATLTASRDRRRNTRCRKRPGVQEAATIEDLETSPREHFETPRERILEEPATP
jgi:hypothetical protein